MAPKTKYSFCKSYNIVLLCLIALLGSAPLTAAETVVYSEGFETSDGGYTHTGALEQWQWGSPDYSLGPATAHQGMKVWGTNLTGDVPRNSDSYLTSPQ